MMTYSEVGKHLYSIMNDPGVSPKFIITGDHSEVWIDYDDAAKSEDVVLAEAGLDDYVASLTEDDQLDCPDPSIKETPNI
jgi:hypothetical protein